METMRNDTIKEQQAEPTIEPTLNRSVSLPPVPEAQRPFRAAFTERLFPLFLLVFSYVLTLSVPISGNPFGFFLLAVFLFGAATVYGLLNGAKIRWDAILCLVFGLTVSSYYLLNGRPGYLYADDLFYPCFPLAALSYAYYIYCLFGNRTARGFNGVMLLEWLQALILNAVLSFHRFFVALFHIKRQNKRTIKPLLFGIIGILLAIGLCWAVVVLLSFDAHFASAAQRIRTFFTFDADELFEIFFRLWFAVPLAALIYGMSASAKRRILPNFAKEQTVQTIASKLKAIPFVIAAIPIGAVLVIYGLFFFTQIPYYMSAFQYVLPDGYSASEYARNGFFELCGTAAINTFLILLLRLFTKQNGNVTRVFERILTILLSVETLVLIATALSKMFLYISRYDLTLKRLWPTFFLLFLAVGYLALLLSVCWKKVRVLPILLTLGILFSFCYPLCNVNRLVAKYNVDTYFARIDQTKDQEHRIDVGYLYELGESAVPELVRLYNNPRTDDSLKQKVLNALKDAASEQDHPTKWFSYSLYTVRNNDVIREIIPSK